MRAKAQLDLALRKNRGRRIIGEWARRLTQACGYKVRPENFLSLERTDELRQAFAEKLKAGEGVARVELSSGSLTEISNVLKDLAIDFRSTPTVLFSSMDEYLGAVELPASILLLNFQSVWQVVEQDFSLATPSLEDGLCVEVNFYDAAGNYVRDGVHQLATWGMFSPPANKP